MELKVAARTVEIQQIKDRLEIALETAQIGTWEWDLRSGNLTWSEIMKKLYAYHPEDFPMNQFGIERHDERVHPLDRAGVNAALEKALKEHKKFKTEYRIIWPDKSIHWIASHGKIEYDAQGNAVRMMGTGMNIDDRKKSQEYLEKLVLQRTQELTHAQAALLQAGKMSALVEMAGGVAHEINTPLAAITMKAQQLERRAKRQENISSDTLLKESRIISEIAKRIGTIINGLRAFAREGTDDPLVHVSASQIIDNVLSLCQSRFKHHGIEIKYTPPDKNLKLDCRLIPLEQTFLNLLSNSFDAIVRSTEKWIHIEILDQDKQVAFKITDSGLGIPKAVLAKIMQPFFTTKALGKGTGLGLSISKGIIEEHQGTLEIDTNSPNTCFIIRLPKIQMTFQEPSPEQNLPPHQENYS